MNVVFDVDGTLCFDGRTLAPRIVQALKKLENDGHQVIFASARPIRDLLPVVPEFTDNILIGGNGSIVSQKQKIDIMDFIPIKEYKEIIELIKEFNLKYVIDGPFNYAANVTEEDQIFNQLDPAGLAENIPYTEIKVVIKIILVDIQPELFSQVHRRLTLLGENLSLISHRNENSLDITAKGINKYTTLTKLKVTNYTAFGNDSNDFELLKHGRVSYFVGEEALAKELGLSSSRLLPKNVDKIVAVIEALGGIVDD